MARTQPPKAIKRKIRRSRVRVTDATAAARAALTQADVLGISATTARIPQATKGVFSPIRLRSAGDITSYFLSPLGPKTPKPPKPPGKRRRR